jgi:hypothetical protein
MNGKWLFTTRKYNETPVVGNARKRQCERPDGALSHPDRASLTRTPAALRPDIALFDIVSQPRWNGPTAGLHVIAARLDAAITEATKRALGRVY